MPELDFTIGADPEFCAYKRGEGHACAGDYGSTDARVGCDGNGETFEVRPTPSTCPIEVVKSIRHNLVRAVGISPELLKYSWLAGSFQREFSLGGHIHFGTKRRIGYRVGTAILSQYVGSLLLLVEDESEAKMRRCRRLHPYGHADDFRGQPYGFEYRTPSSWLTSPHMAAAALCLSKVVMYEVLNNKKFSPKNFIPESAINEVRMDEIKVAFPKIWAEIETMKLYPVHKKELEYLYALIKNGKNWYVGSKTMNFRPSWNIKVPKNVLKSCTMQDIWCN